MPVLGFCILALCIYKHLRMLCLSIVIVCVTQSTNFVTPNTRMVDGKRKCPITPVRQNPRWMCIHALGPRILPLSIIGNNSHFEHQFCWWKGRARHPRTTTARKKRKLCLRWRLLVLVWSSGSGLPLSEGYAWRLGNPHVQSAREFSIFLSFSHHLRECLPLPGPHN